MVTAVFRLFSRFVLPVIPEYFSISFFLALGPTRGVDGGGGGGGFGRGVDATPISFVQVFKKTIYSKGLKLSVAFQSSSAEILIYQSCVCHFSIFLT